jgi:flagellar motility protein MotE (MotC chaperone)
LNLRLLPVVGIAASALLALKLLGMVLGEHHTVAPVTEAQAQQQPAAPQAAAPASGSEPVAENAAPAAGGETPAEGAAPAEGTAETAPPVPDALEIGGSSAERAVLESLGERRRALQDQAGELDLREKLLQATEERLQKRVDELKSLEQQIQQGVEEKKKQEEGEIAALVVMYENMKPKDAARIFDRLELDVLLKVVRQMKPRKMADILAKMSPEAAEKLTVAIASGEEAQPQGASAPAPAALPKIGSN